MYIIEILESIERGEITPEKGAALIRRHPRRRMKSCFIKIAVNTDDVHINYIPPLPIIIIKGLVNLVFGIYHVVEFFMPDGTGHWLNGVNARDINAFLSELSRCGHTDIVDINAEGGRTHVLIRAI
ncbi:hypothetical protein [Mahella australiensis]|uniref:Uncharacterized protein n=1 Tax=Mahella australiensis (strain DSM 15567 / CIP 107919 / 50-1 BON) TaxID=697281 RepID=F4A3B5_MAHA5|nr:hypothetical protein [Mahella australiensis]AEE97370.1 hypothetical protein Mahau_2198 [Mahella australiensis 50-1 BON]